MSDQAMNGKVQIAVFFSFEVDKAPLAVAESPALEGSLPLEDALSILEVISRVMGQDLIVAFPTEEVEADAGAGGD